MFRILIFSLFFIMIGCACVNYVRETKTLYDENGIKFSVFIRGYEGIIYVAGPYVDFIAENNTASDLLYLMEAIMKVDNADEFNFIEGRYYVNNELKETYYPLPATISNNCRWEGGSVLPEASELGLGKKPASLRVKFKLNEEEKEINKDFEVTIKLF